MDNKQCIGRCSCCGGRVMQYTVLWIVGPFPPAKCESCGATEAPKGPVIPMFPKKGHGDLEPNPNRESQQEYFGHYR